MSSVPLTLPLRARDAAALAGVIFEIAGPKPVGEGARNRVSARIPSLQMSSLRPYTASLVSDPIHPTAYFIAVDAISDSETLPLLLRIANASSPGSGLFPNPLLIGRMRAGLGPEVVVNAIPFGPGDSRNVRAYASQLDQAFLPRPLGSRPPFSIASRDPGTRLPGAFEAFRYLLRNRRVNAAVIATPELSADSVRGTCDAAMWAAIRAGWRDGFALEAGPFDLLPEATELYTTFICPAELEPAIVGQKEGHGAWKRFDPDSAIEQRTADLTALLDAPGATNFADIILEFV